MDYEKILQCKCQSYNKTFDIEKFKTNNPKVYRGIIKAMQCVEKTVKDNLHVKEKVEVKENNSAENEYFNQDIKIHSKLQKFVIKIFKI